MMSRIASSKDGQDTNGTVNRVNRYIQTLKTCKDCDFIIKNSKIISHFQRLLRHQKRTLLQFLSLLRAEHPDTLFILTLLRNSDTFFSKERIPGEVSTQPSGWGRRDYYGLKEEERV